jgi:hypothetical protein
VLTSSLILVITWWRWLTLREAEITRGDWLAPDAAKVPFSDYAGQWLDDRVLKPRTQELYLGLLRNHLLPAFGSLALADIDEAAVRRWRKERLDAGPHAARPFAPSRWRRHTGCCTRSS